MAAAGQARFAGAGVSAGIATDHEEEIRRRWEGVRLGVLSEDVAWLLRRVRELSGQPVPAPSEILAQANGKRIRLGMSWRAVGRAVGCSASTLSRWGSGSGMPSVETLCAVWRWAVEEGESPPGEVARGAVALLP